MIREEVRSGASPVPNGGHPTSRSSRQTDREQSTATIRTPAATALLVLVIIAIVVAADPNPDMKPIGMFLLGLLTGVVIGAHTFRTIRRGSTATAARSSHHTEEETE